MNQHLAPIINAEELLILYKTNELVIVDASAGNASKERYKETHLEGALYVDMDTQLADIKPEVSNGGRHPLPTPAQFSETLGGLGIKPASHVVVYDDKKGSNAAARFWWMLKAAGHKKVQVLNGGFDAAVKAGIATGSKTETPAKADSYQFENWLLPLADINEVEQVSQDDHFMVIDVRDEVRYRGEKEPIDLIAGHIPGAVNIPFAGNLDAEGYFLSPDQLKEKYKPALANKKTENIIVHCGSGVTACHTILAMDYAGIEIPKLYVGSWSEWSQSKRPVAKEL